MALSHQVCKSQVLRNTEALIETLTSAVAQDPDGSLAAIGVSGPQAVADLQQLGTLIHTRQPEQVTDLEHLFYRYAQAGAPRQGEHASLAYRMRWLFLDRWNLWPRLTCYRTRCGPQEQSIDGTTDANIAASIQAILGVYWAAWTRNNHTMRLTGKRAVGYGPGS